jgi:pyrroloquinoline quinone biosynthesis protein B
VIVKVLGSAAGGGFPQLNCQCANCAAVRGADPAFTPRTQASLAVTADRRGWVLINASPDLRQQVGGTPELAPRPGCGPRASPIGAVVLTGADVDAIAGLLSLREALPFTLFAAAPVLEVLASNSVFDVLGESVRRTALPLGVPVAAPGAMLIEAFPVPGKVALYLERGGEEQPARAGDTLGLRISDGATGAAFFYVPGCATVDAALAERLRGAALVLFDGTLYTDDEMIAQGLSPKTGRRMGHLAMAGPHGSMAACAGLGIGRRIYVHINNSNPVLNARSAERAAVERAGWEVGYDGMEITL